MEDRFCRGTSGNRRGCCPDTAATSVVWEFALTARQVRDQGSFAGTSASCTLFSSHGQVTISTSCLSLLLHEPPHPLPTNMPHCGHAISSAGCRPEPPSRSQHWQTSHPAANQKQAAAAASQGPRSPHCKPFPPPHRGVVRKLSPALFCWVWWEPVWAEPSQSSDCLPSPQRDRHGEQPRLRL
jgi:hypothetical protein